jgi:hypothetical protein
MRRSLIALSLVAVVACTDDGPSGPGIEGDSHVETYVLSAQPPPKLDVLFVVDDTTAMASHQAALEALPAQVDALLASEAGNLASYHLGVVTTEAAGGGTLRTSTAVTDAFIVHDNTFDTPEHNYQGALADAFASLLPGTAASTASNQPLETTKLALASGANPGFVRDDALLGLVTITASDDASQGGAEEYADELKAKKTDPANVVAIGVYPPGAARLDAFHAQFPNRSEVRSIDDADYGDALALFTQLYRTILGYSCVQGPADLDPVTAGPQYDCSFVAIVDGVEQRLPQCSGEVTEPCWEFVEADPQICTDAEARMHLQTRGFTASTSSFGDPYHPDVRGQCIVSD